MPLHRLTHIVMGVPNVEQTAAYYTEFGLIPTDGPTGPAGGEAAGSGGRRTFATVDVDEVGEAGMALRDQLDRPDAQFRTRELLAELGLEVLADLVVHSR